MIFSRLSLYTSFKLLLLVTYLFYNSEAIPFCSFCSDDSVQTKDTYLNAKIISKTEPLNENKSEKDFSSDKTTPTPKTNNLSNHQNQKKTPDSDVTTVAASLQIVGINTNRLNIINNNNNLNIVDLQTFLSTDRPSDQDQNILTIHTPSDLRDANNNIDSLFDGTPIIQNKTTHTNEHTPRASFDSEANRNFNSLHGQADN